ncbi:MAG TPA: metallophosphoesterase [Terriglobales bacterium]|nr:metallophosphoesterase [Terriglobales bacterium]
MSSVSRRKFLITACFATVSSLALAEDTVIREPNHPELVKIDMPLPRLPAAFDGFTIAQLSDFHYDDVFSIIPIRRAIEIVNQLQPDLVVLTGDFVTFPLFAVHDEPKAAKAAEPCAKLLSQLRSRLGSLAVLGNHDVGADPNFVTEALRSHGISVLRNRSQAVEQNGGRLWFCGLDSLDRSPRIDLALRGVPQAEAVVLLVHEPDFADQAARYPVDLQVSGHSHGGQVWLPGIGAPWLPRYARKYPRGRYRVGALPVYTNVGLGTIRVPIRLNCTPEVTLFTLRAGKANSLSRASVYTNPQRAEFQIDG